MSFNISDDFKGFYSPGFECELYPASSLIINFVKNFNGILTFIYIIEIIFIILQLLIFFVKKWKNPSKIYYYLICANNVFIYIFIDIYSGLFFSLTNLQLMFTSFPDVYEYISILRNYYYYYFPFIVIHNFRSFYCELYHYIIDTLPLISFMTILLLEIHRMFIVLFPLKSYLIMKIFCKKTIFIFICCLAIIFIPDFWTFKDSSSCFYYNIFASLENKWFVYYEQVKFARYIVPTIGIFVSVTVISVKILHKKYERLKMIKHISKISKAEERTTIIFILFGLINFLSLTPYSVCTSILTFKPIYYFSDDQDCFTFNFFHTISYIQENVEFLPIISRIFDGIILFMIPEFRKLFIKLFKCCLLRQ